MNAPFANADLKAMEAKLGRPLRVLHIGNIANNAYNNARIQRQYGIEADVLSYDYYHVMSTPEWEDAEFTGNVDPDAPNWWSTSLKGWKRPGWFVQGPADACIQYLKSRRMGLDRLSKMLWVYLEARSLGHVRYLEKASGKPLTPLSGQQKRAILVVEGLGVQKPPRIEAYGPSDSASATLKTAPLPEPPGNARSVFRNMFRPLVRAVFAVYSAALATGATWARGVAWGTARVAAMPLALSYLGEARRLQSWRNKPALAERDASFDARLAKLMADCVPLSEEDRVRVQDYALHHPRRFFRLLSDYDVIQAYSLDGFIPAMNSLPAYAVYEHGTLRDLPFEQSFYGFITRAAYREASLVFVTNSDVLPSVERMGLDPARVVCLPHAFDDRKLMKFRADNPQLQPPAGPAIFFSPTRHHWQDKSGSWTKGNDVLLRAAGMVAGEGLDFRLHLVEWGQEVAASKALIAELGIADKVLWLPTMQKAELWAAYCTAHAVVDQFSLPALGGVGFEAMALGRRLITAIDDAQLAQFFGQAPPCLSASTVAQCATQLRAVIADSADMAGRGVAAAGWMHEFHSARRIVALQAKAYRALLERLTEITPEATLAA